MIGDTLFGAEGSRHSNSCFVLALHENSGKQRLAKFFSLPSALSSQIMERGLQCELQLYHGLIPISVKWISHSGMEYIFISTNVFSTVASYKVSCSLHKDNS